MIESSDITPHCAALHVSQDTDWEEHRLGDAARKEDGGEEEEGSHGFDSFLAFCPIQPLFLAFQVSWLDSSMLVPCWLGSQLDPRLLQAYFVS